MITPDPAGRISQHFIWKEALWLPQWNRLSNEVDGLSPDIIKNLVTLFLQMDVVRDFFSAYISVHCAYRPDAYNKLVNGAKNSAHKLGMAVDFDVLGFTCDQAKQNILDHDILETWGMRLENNGKGATWLHLDQKDVGPGGRYFIP